MRLSKTISYLLAIGAIAAFVITKTLPRYDSFREGAPVLAVQDVKVGLGSSLGTVAVAKGRYYLVSAQSDAVEPFRLFFTFQDQATSKILIDDPRVVGPNHPFQSVIKADRDDPAAALTVGRDSGPEQLDLRFSRVDVTELNPHFYFWRSLLRAVAMTALLAAFAYLLWQMISGLASALVSAGKGRQPAPAGDPGLKPSFWSIRRVGAWATFLLTFGVCSDVFFLENQHAHLLDKPFQSSITGWDGSYYYFWLRSVMVDGDVDVANDLLYCNSMPMAYRREIVRDTPRTATGLIPDKYPIGWALSEVPWYLGGELAAHVINLRGGQVPYDGWGPVYQLFLVLGQVVYGTASLYFAFRILTELIPTPFAVCGLVLGGLGSPLFFYQTLDVIMSHNVMFFAVTGAYYFCYRLRERPAELRNWLLVGLLSAFVILARYQGGVLLLFPGVVCLQEVAKNYRRLSGLAVAVVAGAIPLSLQMLAWKVMYGSFFLYTYQHETFSWRHPHLYEVLFSPLHGLFNWHPMMLIGFAGFLAWAVLSRRWTEAFCFTVSLLLVTYINAAWDVWWFGASFGSRAFESCTLFSMLGLGFLLKGLSRSAWAFHSTALALLLLAVWNLNLMWMTQMGRLPFEVPLTWSQRIDLSWNYWAKVL